MRLCTGLDAAAAGRARRAAAAAIQATDAAFCAFASQLPCPHVDAGIAAGGPCLPEGWAGVMARQSRHPLAATRWQPCHARARACHAAAYVLTCRRRRRRRRLQAQRAAELAEAVLSLDPRNVLALFVLGQARSTLGSAAAAADAFRSAAALTRGAPEGQRRQLHMAALENMLLACDAALPPNWIAQLHDEARLEAVQAGVAAAVHRAGPAARVLVCGGLGLEAVLAARAGAAGVTAYCPGDPFTASLAAELAADSGCADCVATAHRS